MKHVTTRDIVIPAGTEIGPGPVRSDYFTPHGEVIFEINKDSCGHLRFDLEEALEDGLIREVSE